MDTGLTVRSTASGKASFSRRQAVATELAPAQTVTAAAGAANAGSTARPTASDPSRLGDAILDPHSREVIYRTAEVQSRRVVRQMPEVAARRLKAYTRFAKERTSSPDPQADLEV